MLKDYCQILPITAIMLIDYCQMLITAVIEKNKSYSCSSYTTKFEKHAGQYKYKRTLIADNLICIQMRL